jgi:hypothetical protein
MAKPQTHEVTMRSKSATLVPKHALAFNLKVHLRLFNLRLHRKQASIAIRRKEGENGL